MLDLTFEDTWRVRDERLVELGMSYEKYLRSGHWKKVRKKALERSNYQVCEICSSTIDINLHHSSYKSLMEKDELSYVNAFCRKHHNQIHNFAKKYKVSVRLSTMLFKNPRNNTKNQIVKIGTKEVGEFFEIVNYYEYNNKKYIIFDSVMKL